MSNAIVEQLEMQPKKADFDFDDDFGEVSRMPKLRPYNSNRRSSSDDNASKVSVNRQEKQVRFETCVF